MKRLAGLIIMLAAMAAAQDSKVVIPLSSGEPPARVEQPSDSDLYCGGYVTNVPLNTSTIVAAGLNFPHQARYAGTDLIYLSGAGLQEGARFTIVRKLYDPDRYEPFPHQREVLAKLGEQYAEIALVTITKIRTNVGPPVGIAKIDLSCEAIAPGDVAVPFYTRQRPPFRPSMLTDRFAPRNGLTTGFIVASRDFDLLVSTNKVAYLNIGASQGVQVGDYFRAVRTYVDEQYEQVENLSFKAPMADPTQKDPRPFDKTRIKELPRRILGEMVVLNVTPTSSTVLITKVLEEIRVGEGVEKEPPPPPVIPPQPPGLRCSANPETVRVGESSTITCTASNPDNRPLAWSWMTSTGRLTPNLNVAVLDTRGVVPGPVDITTRIVDDRNMSASTVTRVNVVATPARPVASRIAILAFKRGSARVDNKAKAQLDDVALLLKRNPNANALIIGETARGEAPSLAGARARNAKLYLTESKGVDPARIVTRSHPGGGSRAEVWIIPPGADMPAGPDGMAEMVEP